MIRIFKIYPVENNQPAGVGFVVDLEFENKKELEEYRKEQEIKLSTKSRKISIVFGFTKK